MNAKPEKTACNEREATATSGWRMLVVNLALLFGAMGWLIWIIVQAAKTNNPAFLVWLVAAIFLKILAVILLCGHFTLQPNEARVLTCSEPIRGQ